MLGYSHIKPFFHPKHLIKSEFNSRCEKVLIYPLAVLNFSTWRNFFMLYQSYFITRSDGCAPKTERVLSQPPIQRRNSLARAIALLLMAGSVVVPASVWAATIQGYKFIDSDGNGQKTSGEIGLKDETIYIKSVNAPLFIRPYAVTTDSNGYFSYGVPPDTYRVWESPEQPSGKMTLLTSYDTGQQLIIDSKDVSINFPISIPPQLPDVQVISDSNPIVAKVGEAVTFTAKISDPNLGDSLIYRYIFGDAGWSWHGQTPISLIRSASKEDSVITLSHVYNSPGDYVMTVAATDYAAWNWDYRVVMGSVNVKVVAAATNTPPTAAISPHPSLLACTN
jgi:PKD domain